MPRPRLSPEERKQRRREAALKGIAARAAKPETATAPAETDGPDRPGDPRERAGPGRSVARRTSTDTAHELRIGHHGPANGTPGARLALAARPGDLGGQADDRQLRASQRPRRGLPAAGRFERPGRAPGPRRPGRRDATRPARRSWEKSPAPRPRPWKPPSSTRCEKSGRSGPDRGAARHAPGDDRHAPTEEEHRRPTTSRKSRSKT